MQTMLELEELGFSSLEEYLRSPQMKSEGGFGTELECDGAGGVHLSLSRAKAALEYHYLLLVPARGEGETLLLRGSLDENGVCFDLNELGDALFQHCDEWVCRVAMGDSREFLVSRLREKGDPASQPPAAPAPVPAPAPVQKPVEKPRSGGFGRLKGLFGGKKAPEPPAPTPQQTAPAAPAAPAFHLWADSKRLFDTGLSAPVDDVLQRLVFKANAERRTVSLVRQPEAVLRPLLDGRVFHRCKASAEQHPFQFSIVMAVYNVAPYLEEAVESVLQQDIGFQKNVQLILMDDGSTDGSGLLCNRFAQRFPKNVVALHQANAGVASARNAGLAAAKGAYVNFMDPDDKLSPNALSAVSRFFSAHAEEVDVVSIPMYFFEAQVGSYWQNYKFDRGTRVIDLWREPLVSDMSASSSFFRLECLGALRFLPLRQGEDTLFVAQTLLPRMQLGVVADAVYWYRRRSSGNSRVDTASAHLDWYTDCVRELYHGLLDLSRQRFGFVPDFVLNTLMMDLRWRFKPRPEPEGGLTASQRGAYSEALARVLEQMDERIVLSQRKLPFPELVQILTLKYHGAPTPISGASDRHAVVDGRRMFSFSELPIHMERIFLDADALELEGYVQIPAALAPKELRQYVYAAGDYYVCEPLERRTARIDSSFGPLLREYGFRCRLPLGSAQESRVLRLVSVMDGQCVFHRSYQYERTTAFHGGLNGQYLWCPGAVLLAEKTGLRLERTQDPRSVWERGCLNALEAQVVTPEQQKRPVLLPWELTPERLDQVRTLRAAALEQPREKPLWLLCDGANQAGGPGEQLFRSLRNRPDCPAELCFVLAADSPDFPRLRALGTVLPFGSREHLEAFLRADVVCFSQEQEELLSPFTGTVEGCALRRYYADLLSRQRYVFLRSDHAPQGGPVWEETLARKYPREELVLSGEADVPKVLEVLI